MSFIFCFFRFSNTLDSLLYVSCMSSVSFDSYLPSRELGISEIFSQEESTETVKTAHSIILINHKIPQWKNHHNHPRSLHDFTLVLMSATLLSHIAKSLTFIALHTIWLFFLDLFVFSLSDLFSWEIEGDESFQKMLHYLEYFFWSASYISQQNFYPNHGQSHYHY